MVRYGWVDYPTRRRRYNRRYRAWSGEGSHTRWTKRYQQPRKKKWSGRTQYTNVPGMGMTPTYGFFGGTWSTRSVGADGVLGPWTPALG